MMIRSATPVGYGDTIILFSSGRIYAHTPSSKFVVRGVSGLNSNSSSGDLNENVPAIKFVKPRNLKLSKWSKGDGPGEYGGPPAYTEPRKYWGGDNSDPITNKNDFIWNKEWLAFVQTATPEIPQLEAPQKEQEAGFLSLNRAMSLDSLEVDLSEELMKPSASILEQQVEAARLGISTEVIRADKPRWQVAPTTREQEKWKRASKATTGGTGILMRNINGKRDDPAVLAAQSREQYIQLKKRLQLITLALGGLGIVSAYVSYSPEVATSFGVGFLGSLAYIRMLGNSVDSYGKQGVKGAARNVSYGNALLEWKTMLPEMRKRKYDDNNNGSRWGWRGSGARNILIGVLGQPRLLVPVILVMTYNRWNGILVPDYGFVHLDLIPMLVGFFTYKIATFVQVVQDVLPTTGGKVQS